MRMKPVKNCTISGTQSAVWLEGQNTEKQSYTFKIICIHVDSENNTHVPLSPHSGSFIWYLSVTWGFLSLFFFTWKPRAAKHYYYIQYLMTKNTQNAISVSIMANNVIIVIVISIPMSRFSLSLSLTSWAPERVKRASLLQRQPVKETPSHASSVALSFFAWRLLFSSCSLAFSPLWRQQHLPAALPFSSLPFLNSLFSQSLSLPLFISSSSPASQLNPSWQ